MWHESTAGADRQVQVSALPVARFICLPSSVHSWGGHVFVFFCCPKLRGLLYPNRNSVWASTDLHHCPLRTGLLEHRAKAALIPAPSCTVGWSRCLMWKGESSAAQAAAPGGRAAFGPCSFGSFTAWQWSPSLPSCSAFPVL